MKPTPIKQNLSYFFCLLLTLLLSYLLFPQKTPQVHGIFLPNKTSFHSPPVPITHLHMTTQKETVPLAEKLIGSIHLAIHINSHDPVEEAEKKALAFAKKLAAQKGGHTLLITQAYVNGTDELEILSLQAHVYA